eukprot:TRINITY_DN18185_c0_g1_i1.p1 TRINITY_DN18185_c0_g1~~TRINITY_DN18185_c0_g1_i1.p1  ORF type:complete len:108 (+),score=1.90 TRINITY_DN18185_c0_g1_i1:77-400(+)
MRIINPAVRNKRGRSLSTCFYVSPFIRRSLRIGDKTIPSFPSSFVLLYFVHWAHLYKNRLRCPLPRHIIDMVGTQILHIESEVSDSMPIMKYPSIIVNPSSLHLFNS